MNSIGLISEDGKEYTASINTELGLINKIKIPSPSLKNFFDEQILKICLDNIQVDIYKDRSVIFRRKYQEFAKTTLLRPFEDFRSYVLLLAINTLMPFINISAGTVVNIVPEKLMNIDVKLLK